MSNKIKLHSPITKRKEDPVFDTPSPITDEKVRDIMIVAMHQANIKPEFIYAFEKTGLFLTHENIHNALPEDILAWRNAALEFKNTIH